MSVGFYCVIAVYVAIVLVHGFRPARWRAAADGLERHPIKALLVEVSLLGVLVAASLLRRRYHRDWELLVGCIAIAVVTRTLCTVLMLGWKVRTLHEKRLARLAVGLLRVAVKAEYACRNAARVPDQTKEKLEVFAAAWNRWPLDDRGRANLAWSIVEWCVRQDRANGVADALTELIEIPRGGDENDQAVISEARYRLEHFVRRRQDDRFVRALQCTGLPRLEETVCPLDPLDFMADRSAWP